MLVYLWHVIFICSESSRNYISWNKLNFTKNVNLQAVLFFIHNKKNLNKLGTKCTNLKKNWKGAIKIEILRHTTNFSNLFIERVIFFRVVQKFTSPGCHVKISFVDPISIWSLVVGNVITLPLETDFSLLDFNIKQKGISRIRKVMNSNLLWIWLLLLWICC